MLVYLENNRRWIDLRPFASIVIQFSKIGQNGASGLWMLDDLELMRAPRSRCEDVYRMAIMDGGITLPHGRPLPRRAAIRGACYEEMDSLAPLIREYVKAEYPEEGAKLLTALELGAGAEDREDAIRLSARHLPEMDAAAVYDKMTADGDFRSVVIWATRRRFLHSIWITMPFGGTKTCVSTTTASKRKKEGDLRTRSFMRPATAGNGTLFSVTALFAIQMGITYCPRPRRSIRLRSGSRTIRTRRSAAQIQKPISQERMCLT